MKIIKSIINQINKYDLIFSIIGTIIFYTGNIIFYNHKFNIIIFLLLYLLIIVSLLIIKNIYLKLRKYNIKSKKTFTKKQILIMMIPIILIHLICYIGYFPGTFSYDINAVNNMATSKLVWSNVNPVIYTILWSLCYKLELLLNISNFRIILYTIIQLSFIIFTYYYLFKWLIKNNYNKPIIIITYIYILINPILHLMSIITSKDVIVSYLFLLFILTFINLNNNYNKKNIVLLFILGLLCLLFTNNFLPLMIIIFIILFFYERKLSLVVLNSILIYSFILILLPIFNIRYTQPHEALSVPIVQMSYIYNNTNTYTTNDKKQIKSIIPNIEDYNPRLVDQTKSGFNYIKFNKTNIFWKMYIKGLINNPISYLKTFLNLNIRIWYPQINNYDKYTNRVFIEDYPYLNDNYNNVIYKFYHSFTSCNTISKIPLFNIFYSFAFPFYFLLLSLYLYKTKKYNKRYLIVNIFVLSYLLLYLLGPVTIFRYLLYFYVCFPILLIGLFNKEGKD